MIAGLVLAAGESSRMGKDKALLEYRGRTFLETIVETLRSAGVSRIVVVLGHHAEEILRAVKLDQAQGVVNSDYQRGQTSSLQMGLKAAECPELEAIILSLVDHPAVSAQTIRKLIQEYRQSHAPVVVPTYRDERGHPVLVGCPLFEELKGLSADRGANSVIRQYRAATRFVEVPDPGILLDVDDAETYRNLQET